MLHNYWYPLLFAVDFPAATPVAVTLFGEPLVLFRDASGVPQCLADRCAHRSVPLSLGQVCDGKIECMYHGWKFSGQGKCEHIPSLEEGEKIPSKANVPSKVTLERDGLIWVWAGETFEADVNKIPVYPQMDSDQWIVAKGTMDLEVDYSLLIENLVDPSHVPFVHRNTLAHPGLAQPLDCEIQRFPNGGLRGEFKATRIPPLPVPDFFEFEPPCHVRVGKHDGSIARLFHCVPSAPGKVRFIWWLAFEISKLDEKTRSLLADPKEAASWLKMVEDSQLQIYTEDFVMLNAQQLRINQNALAFACPVSVDKFAHSVRQWRLKNEGDTTWFKGY
ncbi:hypothetical protein CKQ84_08440 [Shewanella sp. WE21]|uniref:aromatic ring-hydroxylating dioxygenase subunit alpha n=1 Tax=Shewanella sp. WE21 TaxID=2029986 RepID=UPI000CF61735|nr:Rieske 2Fe-2S domain-containing protein [Shewanella sp. WE21]AVI65897.1 hypothetical protein CKQ84_08440 [Shewanella sp. WE21]